jgi:chaperonin GroEL (HSP60 family)
VVDEFETLRGRDAQKHIVGKAIEVGERVRSTLGPLGFDKMMVDKMGEYLLTNDGATILKMRHDRDPVARIVAQVAKAQEAAVFDGTTSTVILLTELLKLANILIEKGVHPNAIMKGYRHALEIAIETAHSNATKGESPYEAAKKVARTAMTGKSAEDYIEILTDICAKAAEAATPDNIKLIGRPGDPKDAELVEGVVILKQCSYPTDKEEFSGNILLLDEELGPPQANVSLADPSKIAQVAQVQQQYMDERLSAIDNLGIKVVLCQKGMDSRAIQHFRRQGILAVRNIRKSDMHRIAKATNGEVVADLADILPDELGSGTCKIRGKEGPNPYIQAVGPNANVASIILPAPTEQAAAEFSRAMDDAIGVAYITAKDPMTVPGAGSIQARMAAAIRASDPMQSSRAELAKLVFAEALLIIPQTLAETASMDIIDTLYELSINPELGVDPRSEKVCDMTHVVEPLALVISCMNGATENAISLLRTDEIQKSKPIQDTFADEMS